jgi:hypothetical protein
MTDGRLYRQHAKLLVLAAGNQLACVVLACTVPMLAWDGHALGCAVFAGAAGWAWHRARYYLGLAEWVRGQIERAEGG